MRRILLAILVLALPVIAQQTDEPVPKMKTRELEFPLVNPPQRVPGASAQRVLGNSGNRALYYWVVATTAVGNSTAMGPIVVTDAPDPLSATATIRISWMPSVGATSYDVLRSSSAARPAGACNCAVATGLTATTATDNSESLSAYTVTTLDPDSLKVILRNEDGSLHFPLTPDRIQDWYDRTAACTAYRGWLEARDCGATGDGVTNDTAAFNLFFSAAASANTRSTAKKGTYRLCDGAISAGHFQFDGGFLSYGTNNSLKLQATTGCSTSVLNFAAGLFSVNLRGGIIHGNSTATMGLNMPTPRNNGIRDFQFTGFPAGSSMIYEGGGLYSVFERNIFSGGSTDLYSFNVQKANAAGGHYYSCNYCTWRDNEIYTRLGAKIGAGQGNLFYRNDVELTIDTPTVIDATDPDMTTGYQMSFNNNYFELVAGSAIGPSVIKPQALALEINGNEMQGPARANPTVSTTLGTTITVGATDTSVTFNPPDCTNIDTDHWYLADAGSTAHREFIKPTAVVPSPCAVTAVFKFDHPSTGTLTHTSVDVGSTCLDLTNTTTNGAAAIISGNRIARCETGIKYSWNGTAGNYSRLSFGNHFENSTVPIAQTLPSMTFTQDKWKSAGGALIADRSGLYLYNYGFHQSECTVSDTILNLAQCNGFSMNIAAGTHLTGVQRAKPGIFWVFFPTAGVIIDNAGFNLCAAADYTVHANERLVFEVKGSTSPVVYELGQNTCIGKQPDGTMLKVVAGKATGAVNGVDYSSPNMQGVTAAGCAPGTSSGDTCSVTLTWGTAYADTTYKATCSIVDTPNGRVVLNGVHKTATQVTVYVVRTDDSSGSTGPSSIDCIGIP